MLRCVVDRGCLVKSVMSYAIFFFLPLFCMDKKKPLVNCGLSPLLIPREVVRAHIKPALSFQDVGRLKQVSKACNKYWSTRKMCLSPHGCACTCSVLACRELVRNFDACTKALVHFAEITNASMFEHLWIYNNKERDASVCAWFDVAEVSFVDRMGMYRGACYSKQQLIDTRAKKLKDALEKKDKVTAKTMLLSYKIDPFTNYESGENVFFSPVCGVCDVDLFLLFLGKNFQVSRTDKWKKSALHYVAEYGTAAMVEELLMMGAHINAVDADGCTPLHYACRKHKRDGETIRLLLKNGADCGAVDKNGNIALNF
jgi:hypothetical protein